MLMKHSQVCLTHISCVLVCLWIVTTVDPKAFKISQSMTRYAWASFGVLRQINALLYSSIDSFCLQYAARTTETGLSTPWCCLTRTCTVYLGDVHPSPAFPVVWLLAVYRVGRHGCTTISCTAWCFVARLAASRFRCEMKLKTILLSQLIDKMAQPCVTLSIALHLIAAFFLFCGLYSCRNQVDLSQLHFLRFLWSLLKVLEDGTYVKPANDKLIYGGMLTIRANIPLAASDKLAAAVTIAIRYSCVRRQSELKPK